ncbi:MAG: DNA polymerase III subunit chi [Rhodospirillales bacterium]|nr:DNA polymerase III subunit chi [Rhodospirillales bacterium]
MTEIAFYHLQTVPLEQALPKLLEKTLEAGKRALVMVASEERVESLNGHLWTYAPESWLPHGSDKDGDAEDQPVWLSSDDANPNGAQFLFLTDGATSGRVAEFDRCFEIFDGRDAAAVDAARVRWKAYAADGHDLTYWRQSEHGGWEKNKT